MVCDDKEKRSTRFFGDARGTSPLVASLLLIALAVVASITTYSWVMSMTTFQGEIAQTEVRIDMVQWNVAQNQTKVTIRNMGAVAAKVEVISIRENVAGSTPHTAGGNAVVSPNLPTTIQAGSTLDFTVVWKDLKLNSGKSYIIRTTCTTGFRYELVAASP